MTHPLKLIEIVAEQSAELPAPRTLPEALGLIRLEIHRLESELAESDEHQDADAVFQALIAISSIAMTSAGTLVLPAMERGQR